MIEIYFPLHSRSYGVCSYSAMSWLQQSRTPPFAEKQSLEVSHNMFSYLHSVPQVRGIPHNALFPLTRLHILFQPFSFGTESQMVRPFLAGGNSSNASGSLSGLPLLSSPVRRPGLVSVMRSVISRAPLVGGQYGSGER